MANKNLTAVSQWDTPRSVVNGDPDDQTLDEDCHQRHANRTEWLKTQIDGHKAQASGAHAASAISYSKPAGSTIITGAHVQDACTQLQAGVVASNTALNNHKAQASGAHQAGSISYNRPAQSPIILGNNVWAACTDLQAGLIETNSTILNHKMQASGAHAASAISYYGNPAGSTIITSNHVQGAINELHDATLELVDIIEQETCFFGSFGSINTVLCNLGQGSPYNYFYDVAASSLVAVSCICKNYQSLEVFCSFSAKSEGASFYTLVAEYNNGTSNIIAPIQGIAVETQNTYVPVCLLGRVGIQTTSETTVVSIKIRENHGDGVSSIIKGQLSLMVRRTP